MLRSIGLTGACLQVWRLDQVAVQHLICISQRVGSLELCPGTLGDSPVQVGIRGCEWVYVALSGREEGEQEGGSRCAYRGGPPEHHRGSGEQAQAALETARETVGAQRAGKEID